MAGSGEHKKRRKKETSIKSDQIKKKVWVLPRKASGWEEVTWTEKGQSSAGGAIAELTYIDLTQNNVYYAANHNQGVEHIPGIPKISLSEVEGGKLDVISTHK